MRCMLTAVLPCAALCLSTYAGTPEALATKRVASGLNRPVFATYPPGDEDRLFIVEQLGVIRILDLNTYAMLPTPFLNIDALVAGPTSGNDERGLLGLAFHPDYASNGFFYVYYINNASDTVVARYSVSADPNLADAGSAQQIFFHDQPQTNHNGGWIAFGPDGHLYIALGDGGNFCDTGTGHGVNGNAQDLTSLLGKMLRIDPSVTPGVGGYTIPADNPFVDVFGEDEIWAFGLRNPWRPSFDMATGDLYIADVGQGQREEINFQAADSIGRENYGWRCFEGNACSSVSGCPTTPCNCSTTGLTMPIHEYTHALGFSLTGGYVYRGCEIPSLSGTYFFADFLTNRIWSFVYTGGSVTDFLDRTGQLSPSIEGASVSSISSFAQDSKGEVYIIEHTGTTNSEIFKIIRAAGGIADFNCSGTVDTVDFLALLAAWGPCAGPVCPWDLNRDGTVDTIDFLELLAQWGSV